MMHQRLNKEMISVSSEYNDDLSNLTLRTQLGSDDRIGVIIDMSCTVAEKIINEASRYKYFNPRKIWMLVMPNEITSEQLNSYFSDFKPSMFNLSEFFLSERESVKAKERMDEITWEVNQQLMKEIAGELDREEVVQSVIDVPPEVNLILNIEAIIDSEVTLIAPNNDAYNLYSIHRKTNHSKLELENIGRFHESYLFAPRLNIPTMIRRKNFNGTILRAICGEGVTIVSTTEQPQDTISMELLHYEYFNRSDELTDGMYDVWAQMSFSLTKLFEETLNMRMLVRCFDDYGWPQDKLRGRNFNGAVGFLERHKAEIAATGFLLRNDRMNALDYVDGTFEFKLGMLFRQPNLATVTNIFILPFSKDVWVALLGTTFLSGAILYVILRGGGWITQNESSATIGEVITFFSGAICQQGLHLNIATLSIRISVICLLVLAFFLFTSYSATIVALLQSPSNFINSVATIIESPVEVGIEDLPYERVFFNEEKQEVIVRLMSTKILPKGENAFVNMSYGIELVRKGLYSFQDLHPRMKDAETRIPRCMTEAQPLFTLYGHHNPLQDFAYVQFHKHRPIKWKQQICELYGAYKEIAETFTEGEKCSLTKLEIFPKKILGLATPKASPYRNILASQNLWLRETGILKRTTDRWTHQMPTCESKSTGFSSVSTTDIFPLFQILTYGMLLSFIIFIFEFLTHRNSPLVKKFINKRSFRKKLFIKQKHEFIN